MGGELFWVKWSRGSLPGCACGLDLSAKGSEEGDLKHLAWQFGYEEVVDRALAEKHARSKPLPTNLHLQHEAEAAARNAAMAAAAAAAGAGVADVKFDL